MRIFLEIFKNSAAGQLPKLGKAIVISLFFSVLLLALFMVVTVIKNSAWQTINFGY